MKNEPLNPDVDENVITVAFGEVPHDIAHPASKNFPEEIDDPLQDLLNEGMIEDEIEEESEHYIFAHDKSWNYSVSMEDTALEMSSNLSSQISRLKEDIKRLKYYLDEMNID